MFMVASMLKIIVSYNKEADLLGCQWKQRVTQPGHACEQSQDSLNKSASLFQCWFNEVAGKKNHSVTEKKF